MSLWLIFSVGPVRCALPAREVVRVLPRAELHPVTGMPEYLAGQLLYMGQAVPVLDLCQLMLERPCASVYSTRIVLVDFPTAPGATAPLGLMAERVIEARRMDSAQFQPCTLNRGGFLGEIASLAGDMVQQLKVSALLSPELRERLFVPAVAAP